MIAKSPTPENWGNEKPCLNFASPNKQGCYFMSMWAWTWANPFGIFCWCRWNIWHMGQNIVWCGGIFYHVFMDEQYSWMKMWITSENGWTFSWTLATRQKHVKVYQKCSPKGCINENAWK